MINRILLISIVILLVYSGILTYKLIHFKPVITNTVTTIKGDTVFSTKVIIKPIPYKIDSLIHDTAYIFKDSVQCVADFKKLYKDYSIIKFYRDTLQNDSSATIVINSKVSKNNLDSLNLSFKNNRIKVINTTIVTYKNKVPLLSIGILNEYNNKNLTPFVEYAFKKIDVLGGYNLNTKSLVLGVKFTIINK